jgi:nucleoside-diphosphate-sugar epimerase
MSPISDWASQRIVVTGGAGFLGSNIVLELRSRGAREVFVPRSATYDLREPAAIARLFAEVQPTLVIHAAATVGGISANRSQPGTFFYDNAIMGIHLLEEARKARVGKIVVIGTVCSYPRVLPVPFSEDAFWSGYPEATNAPYGIAKKMLLVQGEAYRMQYGLNTIHLIPVNLFGPGDNYDPASSHVIPAIIDKCLDAISCNSSSVHLWGTGLATRSFLYVVDAAKGIVDAAERYDDTSPMNLGSEEEITIRDLATLIAEITGYTGAFAWDTEKPDGQPRRLVSSALARSTLGWSSSTSLRDGLRVMISQRIKQRGGS